MTPIGTVSKTLKRTLIFLQVWQPNAFRRRLEGPSVDGRHDVAYG